MKERVHNMLIETPFFCASAVCECMPSVIYLTSDTHRSMLRIQIEKLTLS